VTARQEEENVKKLKVIWDQQPGDRARSEHFNADTKVRLVGATLVFHSPAPNEQLLLLLPERRLVAATMVEVAD
jgi:hypothetical protein